MTGFTFSDFVLGNGSAVIGDFTETTANRVWTLDVTPGGQGAVTADVAANVAQDDGGNNNTVAVQASVTYDSVAPGIVITPTGTTTSASPITFTFMPR